MAAVLTLLWKATLASTAAILLILALRRMLQRRLGPELACRAWLVVPVITLAAVLPHPESDGVALLGGALPVLPAIVASVPQAVQGSELATLLPWLWLLGLVMSLLRLIALQQRYVRRLDLTEQATAWAGRVPIFAARAPGATPAVIGALRPRIVVPADFAARYDAVERELVLAHEAMHVRRRDGVVAAALEGFRSVFWFNPLLPLAAACLRFDQELACDAAVLRAQPGQRRRYAEAMMKTQLADTGLPVGCHWQSSQSLKERILMLKQDAVSPVRARIGATAFLGLIGALAATVYAAQPLRPLAAAATNGDTPPGIVDQPAPDYPAAAIAAQEQGVVMLKVHVGSDGRVLAAEPDDTTPRAAAHLTDATLVAAKDWRFKPALHDGVPTDSWVLVPTEFRLFDDEDPLRSAASDASNTIDRK